MTQDLFIKTILWKFTFIKAVCETPVIGGFQKELSLIKNESIKIVNNINKYHPRNLVTNQVQDAIDNFNTIIKIIEKTSTTNLVHNINTIRNLCIRNIEYIKESKLLVVLA